MLGFRRHLSWLFESTPWIPLGLVWSEKQTDELKMVSHTSFTRLTRHLKMNNYRDKLKLKQLWMSDPVWVGLAFKWALEQRSWWRFAVLYFAEHSIQVYSPLGTQGSSWLDTPLRESPRTGRPSPNAGSPPRYGPRAGRSRSCASPHRWDQWWTGPWF